MTLFEFISLDEREQIYTVWEGDFLFFRRKNQCIYLLYRVYNFYVEVGYDSVNDEITDVQAFATPAVINRYFDIQPN